MARPAEKVLVVEDDPKILHLVRTYLERDGFRVQTARDGHEALDQFRAARPALIVLDLMLPEVDGMAVCRAVRAESDVPILMLSARGSVADRIYGLNEGADDYLPKPFSPAELVTRARAILRRSSRDGHATGVTGELRQRDLQIDLDRYEVHRGQQEIRLTAIEFRLLAVLVRANGRVLTRDQLLDAVYGVDAGDILDRTIDVYVGRLREKLGDDADQPRYISTLRGVGYRATPEGSA